MGQSRPLLVYFRSFLITISIQIEKSIDGVLGIRTRGRRMLGTDNGAMAATFLLSSEYCIKRGAGNGPIYRVAVNCFNVFWIFTIMKAR